MIIDMNCEQLGLHAVTCGTDDLLFLPHDEVVYNN